MPLAVETPAPPKNTTFFASSISALSWAAASTGSVIARVTGVPPYVGFA